MELYLSLHIKMKVIEKISCLLDDKTPYASFAKQYIALKIEGKTYEEVIKNCCYKNILLMKV